MGHGSGIASSAMVRSLWNGQDAAQRPGDLRQRVYTSRLLGRDPDLVLHGGGNTSVKSRHTTLLGDEVTIEGSGEDFTIAMDGTVVGAEASVICGNVQTANATVYIIDQVLKPAGA